MSGARAEDGRKSGCGSEPDLVVGAGKHGDKQVHEHHRDEEVVDHYHYRRDGIHHKTFLHLPVTYTQAHAHARTDE